MSKSTISTFQLFEMFPTPESARIYLESRLWPEGGTHTILGTNQRDLLDHVEHLVECPADCDCKPDQG